MQKTLLTLAIVAISVVTFAQKHNIVNASIALRNQNFVEAKQYIDEAYNNESTSNEAKMWNYRSKIYLEIAKQHKELDSEAIFKATEAHLKCMQKDKKGRVIVRKWTNEEDVLAGLVNCGYLLWNKGLKSHNLKDYDSALLHYKTLLGLIPYDNEDQLKRQNITKETIIYESFRSSKSNNNITQSKEFLQELINLNFNHSSIYVEMSNIYMNEGNSDKALEYLSLGREMFEMDQALVNAEINLYIQLGRTSELIGKLGEALELDPENDLLLFNRGTIYDQQGDFTNAEADYKASLVINPDAFGTNYNLGALYFNTAIEQNNKANATSNNSTHKKLKSKADALFAKALPFLEKAYAIDSKDKNTLLSLKQLYYMNGDYAKSSEMKKTIEGLK